MSRWHLRHLTTILRLVLAFFSALTAVSALDNWWSVARGRLPMEKVTKVLTMLALIGAVLSAGHDQQVTTRILVLGLVCGLVGDWCLLSDDRARFLSGVTAFLVGHVLYMWCFLRIGLAPAGWSWAVFGLLVYVLVATHNVTPAAYRLGGAKLAVPLTAYSLVIAAMLVCGWLTGSPLLAAGATVFVASDAVLGVALSRNEFRGPHGWVHVIVMVTYHVGQALIAIGVIHAVD